MPWRVEAAVDGGAGDRTAHGAEHAAQDSAAGTAADRGAGDRAARRADATADQRAVTDTLLVVADRDIPDRDDTAGLAPETFLGRGLHARLHALLIAGTQA